MSGCYLIDFFILNSYFAIEIPRPDQVGIYQSIGKMSSQPHPISQPSKGIESGFLTYTRFAIIAVPCLMALTFSSAVMVPRADRIFAEAGMAETSAAWLGPLVRGWHEVASPVTWSLIVVFALFELLWKRWKKIRGWVVTLLTGGICLVSLTAVTLITISVTTAAPKLFHAGMEKARTDKPEKPNPTEDESKAPF